ARSWSSATCRAASACRVPRATTSRPVRAIDPPQGGAQGLLPLPSCARLGARVPATAPERSGDGGQPEPPGRHPAGAARNAETEPVSELVYVTCRRPDLTHPAGRAPQRRNTDAEGPGVRTRAPPEPGQPGRSRRRCPARREHVGRGRPL